MMITRINIPKSIKRKRLSYKPSFSAILSLAGDYISGLILLPLWIIFFVVEWNNLPQWNSITYVLAFLIVAPLCSIPFLGKLVKITDHTGQLTKQDIIDVIQSRYTEFTFQDGHGMITFTQKPPQIIGFQRKIIVLLDDHDIYLNTFLLGRADARLVIMAIPNYLICRSIKKQLQPSHPYS